MPRCCGWTDDPSPEELRIMKAIEAPADAKTAVLAFAKDWVSSEGDSSSVRNLFTSVHFLHEAERELENARKGG